MYVLYSNLNPGVWFSQPAYTIIIIKKGLFMKLSSRNVPCSLENFAFFFVICRFFKITFSQKYTIRVSTSFNGINHIKQERICQCVASIDSMYRMEWKIAMVNICFCFVIVLNSDLTPGYQIPLCLTLKAPSKKKHLKMSSAEVVCCK